MQSRTHNKTREQTRQANRSISKAFSSSIARNRARFLVDKEQLQRVLEPKNCEVTDEALELRWVGKKEAYHSGYSLTDKIIKPLPAMFLMYSFCSLS